MYINHDDIVTLAAQSADPNKRGDDLLTSMDREISSLLSQVRCISHSVYYVVCFVFVFSFGGTAFCESEAMRNGLIDKRNNNSDDDKNVTNVI